MSAITEPKDSRIRFEDREYARQMISHRFGEPSNFNIISQSFTRFIKVSVEVKLHPVSQLAK